MRAIIVNPSSSRKKGARSWQEIREEVLSRLGGAQEFVTQKEGDATRFAREVAHGQFDMLVIAGGDGTINEVINGLINENGELLNEKLTLGLLSFGRGCDLRRSLGVPLGYRDALGVLLNHKIKKIDVGRAQFKDEFGRDKIRYFHNSFSGGISGTIIQKINQASGLIPAELSYFLISASTFLKSKGQVVELEIDGKKVFEGRCLNVFVSNGEFCGAGMRWAPGAKLDDGLLDVLVLPEIPKLKLPSVSYQIYKGSVKNLSGAKFFRGKSIQLKSPSKLLLEIDGEQPGVGPAQISVLKQVLSFAT